MLASIGSGCGALQRGQKEVLKPIEECDAAFGIRLEILRDEDDVSGGGNPGPTTLWAWLSCLTKYADFTLWYDPVSGFVEAVHATHIGTLTDGDDIAHNRVGCRERLG